MPTVGSYLYKMQNYSKPESMIFLGIHTYIVTFKKKTEVKSKKKKIRRVVSSEGKGSEKRYV